MATIPPLLLLGADLVPPAEPGVVAGHRVQRRPLPRVAVVKNILRLPQGSSNVHGARRSQQGAAKGKKNSESQKTIKGAGS